MSAMSFVPSGSWQPDDFFNFLSGRKSLKPGSLTLHEKGDFYLVVAVMPGFIKDEIQILFKNGVLNIYAASHHSSPLPSLTGMNKRSMHRMVHLHKAVDEKQISYLYEKNILKIWVPKKESTAFKPLSLLRRLIPIERFRKP